MGGVELDESVLMEINSIRELVTAIRSLKAERKQANNKEVVFSHVAEDDKAILLQRHEASILASAGASEFKRVDSPPSGAPGVVTSLGSIFLDLKSGIDAEAEKQRLHKEAENLQKIIRSIEGKLEIRPSPPRLHPRWSKEPVINLRKTKPNWMRPKRPCKPFNKFANSTAPLRNQREYLPGK